MTFGVGQLQFIDSLQFMNSSLNKLTANTSELWSAQCGACGEIKDGSIARDGKVAVTMGRCGKCEAEVRKQRPWVILVERLKHTIANSEDETAHLQAFHQRRHFTVGVMKQNVMKSQTQTTSMRRRYGRNSSAKHSATNTTFT